MSEKLIGSKTDSTTVGERISIGVDQIASTALQASSAVATLAQLERHPELDLVVAYEPHAIRDERASLADPSAQEQFRRLGVLRGRPGIGFPSSVHLERFGAPGRLLLSDDPRMSLLGGLGVMVLIADPQTVIRTIEQGRFEWQCPCVVQILLSGKLGPAVSARDVGLELLRRGLCETVRAVRQTAGKPVVLEFTGPGLRTLSVQERALLCSMAPEVGADCAISGSDEKTELYLRDQRRSKAHRQLVPDAGADCAEVIRIELAAVEPQVMLDDGKIALLGEREFPQVREVVIGGEAAGTIRDMLTAAQWFKSKRAHLDVDVMIVPATRQTLEAMIADGTLSQLLSAGARLIPPDARILSGQWQPPPPNAQSLRSFSPSGNLLPSPQPWAVASVESLCQAAIAGRMQDPRLLRRTTKVPCPRELPIDDAWLFDRKPSSLQGSVLPPEDNSKKSPSADWIDASAPT